MARKGAPRHPRTPLLNNLALVHVFIGDVLQDIAFPPEDVVGDVVNLRISLEDVVTQYKIYLIYLNIFLFNQQRLLELPAGFRRLLERLLLKTRRLLERLI